MDRSTVNSEELKHHKPARVPDQLPLRSPEQLHTNRQPELEALLTDLSEQITAMAEAAFHILPTAGQSTDYPAKTLLGLFVQSRLTGRAVLVLLADPFLAYAAAPLIRTMTECWAHAHFIQHGDATEGGDSHKCRAIALELGMVRHQSQKFEEIFGDRPPQASAKRRVTASFQRQLRELKALHRESGCTTRVTNWTNVQPVLEEMKARHRSIAKQIWVECSSDAHAHAPNRMVSLQDGTPIWGGPSTYQFRFRMLRYTNYTLFYLIASSLLCLAHYYPITTSDYYEVRRRFDTVNANRLARDVRDGKHDHKVMR